eukprot:988313-Pyramimonas_sp.AAC.1
MTACDTSTHFSETRARGITAPSHQRHRLANVALNVRPCIAFPCPDHRNRSQVIIKGRVVEFSSGRVA